MGKILKEQFDSHVLRRLQLTQLVILDEVVGVCNQHDINYCLIGGTLLGAIRHKGFIPWDDDLDIGMPRSDYDRFCRICNKSLGASYYLHSIATDDKYWLSFAKVRKRDTAMDESPISHLNVDKGIYIDIFPLDEVKAQQNTSQNLRIKTIKRLSEVIQQKRGVRRKRKLICEIVSWFLSPISIRALTKLQLFLMKIDNGKDGGFFINYGSNYDTIAQTIPKDKYLPWRKAVFEGKEYNIPNDYDYVLRRVYGDYMQLPAAEKRVFRHQPNYIDFGD